MTVSQFVKDLSEIYHSWTQKWLKSGQNTFFSLTTKIIRKCFAGYRHIHFNNLFTIKTYMDTLKKNYMWTLWKKNPYFRC